MSKENNKKINILKSKFFIRLFSIPACIWILLTLISTIDQSDSESLTWSEFIISNLIVLGIWFIISFLIAKYPKKKWE